MIFNTVNLDLLTCPKKFSRDEFEFELKPR
jgi:hypothetical protein